MPKLRRREQRSQPALEHARTAEERRLKPRQSRTVVSGLGDLEQQLSISRCVAECSHHAVVAVDLDREVEPAQLPPQREIPRDQDHQK